LRRDHDTDLACAISRPIVALVLLAGCSTPQAHDEPTIEFTRIPEAAQGGPDMLDTIAGRVRGAKPGHRLVLFARSGAWWVQPVAERPFTTIEADSTWTSATHLGLEYAALLVEPGYDPPPMADALPAVGGGIVAVASVPGALPGQVAAKTLRFSGYDWEVRRLASDRGGTRNAFDPENAWVDEQGALHLRIARHADGWTCGEVKLTRSLGYGSYLIVVRESSHLEPAAVVSIFTREDGGTDPNSRELGVELSRWGDPASKNAQYVVQPYYVAANVHRFAAPAGALAHAFRWEPGRITFRTFRGASAASPSRAVSEHVFTSGVPTAGNESVRINVYVFGNEAHPLQNEAEVVIEKFEFLP
jgi:hypothetical protein